MPENEIVALEEQGWEALSSGGEDARAFYDRILDQSVVMLLPGGLVRDDRGTVIDSMAGQPWSSYELDDLQSLQPTEDTAVVRYGVVAERDTYGYLIHGDLCPPLDLRRELANPRLTTLYEWRAG